MNVAQIRTFIAVVDRGSFSEAAKELEISQPAVTMQIQALEAALGTALLDRRYRRVDLTEAGKVLLPHARSIVEQIEDARTEISALSGTVSGHVTIAASTTPGVYVVPRLLGAFVSTYPDVTVTVDVHDTSGVVDALEAGRAQLGVTGAIVRSGKVDFEVLGSDELVLVCPAGDPLATRSGVSIAELAEHPWVQRESGSGTRQVAEKVLAEHGVEPQELRVVVELGTGEAVVSAVEGGLGIAIVSRLVAEKAIALGSVALVDVAELPVPRPFYVVTPKGALTRAAQAFRDHLVRILGQTS
jgi:DNA-binding transcriptional LysR family regulator